MRKLVIIILFTIGLIPTIKAQHNNIQTVLTDTAQISLLTSTPWDGAIYALFGHTAIRIKDPNLNIDYIYNYGIFNFNAPNFMMRFVKGETDYMVAGTDFKSYIQEYSERGVGIIEQVFNLTQKEKQDIFNALAINAMPQNRVYRYNYFYDNCSTRPRDIVERYINGRIEYTPTNKNQTYRDLVHECTNVQPWAQFGIDLVIGADADKIISDRQKDFLPLYLMNAYEGAVIKSDSTQRNLISLTKEILEPSTPRAHFLLLKNVETISWSNYPPTNYPLIVGCILLLVTLFVSIFIYKKKLFVLGKIYDTLLFLVAGAGGCIIFFLMFFSEHPCTIPNWNIVWLNPLQLIVALLFFVKPLAKCINYYHFINFVALLIFLLAWCLIPQQLEIAFIPYILSILVRSGMNILQLKKKNKKADYSLPKAAR